MKRFLLIVLMLMFGLVGCTQTPPSPEKSMQDSSLPKSSAEPSEETSSAEVEKDLANHLELSDIQSVWVWKNGEKTELQPDDNFVQELNKSLEATVDHCACVPPETPDEWNALEGFDIIFEGEETKIYVHHTDEITEGTVKRLLVDANKELLYVGTEDELALGGYGPFGVSDKLKSYLSAPSK